MAARKKTAKKKLKAESRAVNALVFIDTNILLDFYRLQPNAYGELLDLIESNVDSLILTEQVEMEFKKNRQSVLLNWLSTNEKLANDSMNVNPPASLSKSKEAKAMRDGITQAKKALKKLRAKAQAAIKAPASDEVYARLSKAFSYDGPYVMNRKKPIRYAVRRRAARRFALGYPPRKDKDLMIGDAVNWEWMIECATTSKKALIIVTKDTDYGEEIEGKVYANDWLYHEFRERTSPRRKLIITRRLTDAFKALHKHVSTAVVQAESASAATAQLEPVTLRAAATTSGASEPNGNLWRSFVKLAMNVPDAQSS